MDTNTTNPARKIGRIHATIGGDYRYATIIEVWAGADGAEIRLTSTDPVGGNDGPGGVHESHKVLASWTGTLPTPAALVKALKVLFATVDAGTVARYGKPTKNFTWYYPNGVITKGLSAAIAKRAMKVQP